MHSFAVIESYLDGCKFNEVGCGCRSAGADRAGTDEWDTAGGGRGGRIRGWRGWNMNPPGPIRAREIDSHVADRDGNYLSVK